MVEKIFKTLDFADIFWNKAPYAIAKVDLGGRIADCNDSLTNLLGYPKDELCALTFDRITQPDDLVRDRELYQQLVTGKIKSYSLKKRYITKSGIMFLAQLYVYGIYDDSGKCLYCIGIVMPISAYGSNFWSFVAKDWKRAKKITWGIATAILIILAKKLFDIDLSEYIK